MYELDDLESLEYSTAMAADNDYACDDLDSSAFGIAGFIGVTIILPLALASAIGHHTGTRSRIEKLSTVEPLLNNAYEDGVLDQQEYRAISGLNSSYDSVLRDKLPSYINRDAVTTDLEQRLLEELSPKPYRVPIMTPTMGI